VISLARATAGADSELFIVGLHVGPNRVSGLDPLGHAVQRLPEVRRLHREQEPVAWREIPTFGLIAAAWQASGAPVLEIGDLRIYRGEVAGHGLMLVTSHGELVNYHPSGMATTTQPAPQRIAEALDSVVRVTGQVRDTELDAVASGVVIAPETVLSVAHIVFDVDPTTLRVDGLPVSAIATLRASEFGVRAELAQRSLAHTLEAGAPVYDGLVDLVLFTVPGLGRPAARLRDTPVATGTPLTTAGSPGGRWMLNHGPVTENDVHLTLAMAGPPGLSGAPVLDPDGAVAGIQSYGSASGPAHFLSPQLIAAFLAGVPGEGRPGVPESR
jgi:hypothetical protein